MIKVYGASDDLIEIEGDIEEEFSCGPEHDYIAFSDGTVLAIRPDSVWRISPVVKGSAFVKIDQCPEDSDEYTDIAYLDGDIKWVVQGTTITHKPR